jgi:hypothetical protein
MPLLQILLTLVVVGVLLWLVNSFIHLAYSCWLTNETPDSVREMLREV